MKIGIISDSHDDWENSKKAVKIFQDKKADFFVHLGDYVGVLTFNYFSIII